MPLSLLTPAVVHGSWPLLLAPFGSTAAGDPGAPAAMVGPPLPSSWPTQVAGVVCSVEEVQRRGMACGATLPSGTEKLD
ncbi:unnamed protein product [Urochloa humidicola]